MVSDVIHGRGGRKGTPSKADGAIWRLVEKIVHADDKVGV